MMNCRWCVIFLREGNGLNECMNYGYMFGRDCMDLDAWEIIEKQFISCDWIINIDLTL